MLFTQRLPFKIVPSLVTAGKFCRGESSLVFVTPSGKVSYFSVIQYRAVQLVIHWGSIDGNPSGDGENCQVLTVLPNLCSLTTGRFDFQADHDLLLYGSKSGVVAFDPQQNVEVFYNEVRSWGLSAYTLITFQYRDGANCIGVFPNLTSKDESLLVVGGNCSLVAFNRLGAEVLWTVTGDVVSSLASIDAELSVEEASRDLVVGSENFCIRIIHKDAVQDEITETDVVTNLTSLGQGYFGYGLRNGTVGVYNRAVRVWRIKCKSKPVSLVAYDINQDGCLELICGWANGKADYANYSNIILVCSVDGEVQGYDQCASEPGVDSAATEELLRELNLRKQQALLQLHQQTEGSRMEHTGSLDVLDDGPCKVQVRRYPRESATFPSGYVVQLRPSRNLPVDLFVKAYAIPAVRSTEQSLFHVLGATVLLPRFSMYRLINEDEAVELSKPVGGVQFFLNDRPQRLIGWIQENFIVNEEPRINKGGNLIVCFQALRQFDDPVPQNGVDGEGILSNLSAKSSPTIWIRMSAKGEAEAHSATREQIVADLAEKMEQLKVTLVKAEGHRLTCNWASAKEMYTELLHANRQLLASFNSRSSEYQLLTDYQKRINQLIEQASSLRGRCCTFAKHVCKYGMNGLYQRGHRKNNILVGSDPELSIRVNS
ncbi:hypothetical protein X801_05745, partial [Opisthorchis viverrini]